MDGINVKENDLYLYFEAIQQLEPIRVLDIGMLLKRAGSVSRKAMNREVAKEIQLDGVDFFPETTFPAWKNIYNYIVDERTFWKSEDLPNYDCTFLLGLERFSSKIASADMLRKVERCTKYALTDFKFDEWSGRTCRIRIIDLKVDDDAYYLYVFGV